MLMTGIACSDCRVSQALPIGVNLKNNVAVGINL